MQHSTTYSIPQHHYFQSNSSHTPPIHSFQTRCTSITLQHILPTLLTHTNTISTINPSTPHQYNFHQHLYQTSLNPTTSPLHPPSINPSTPINTTTSLNPITSPRIPQPHAPHPHTSLHQHLYQTSLTPTTSQESLNPTISPNPTTSSNPSLQHQSTPQ
ncbi:hypothetical protein Pmani_017904 [Petrolisthes manimaculis]|uniref:Uncharacterized protein n=1 Tax=Petrolisthes manimaculis TaxID=1843537 RepID=A0AAE1U5C8_9EUCA|nr:hypothetical protein Pmani_017904 [Petrolisthes manimaculis]